MAFGGDRDPQERKRRPPARPAPKLTLETPGMSQSAEALKFFGANVGYAAPFAQYAPALVAPRRRPGGVVGVAAAAAAAAASPKAAAAALRHVVVHKSVVVVAVVVAHGFGVRAKVVNSRTARWASGGRDGRRDDHGTQHH